MLVFIDESGDPGFKVEKGSSPIFVAAMVLFANNDDARNADRVIRDARERLRAWPEFKFNKSSASVRDGFFRAVRDCPFLVRAIVVRKQVIYSPYLRAYKDEFYRFFVRQMMTHDNDLLDGAKIVIDGSGDREFRNLLKVYLRRHLGGRLVSVKYGNSKNDPLVQLADMCVGAIARSYRTDRKDAERWRRLLEPKIDNVWEFR